jgi:hypothetical protein
MATLNQNLDDDSDSDDTTIAKNAAAQTVLSWHWITWPTNLRRAFVSMVSLAIGLVALTQIVQWVSTDFSKQLQKQTALKQQVQTQLQNSDQERRDLETNLPLLRELEANGIFGEEKRLEWVEQLRGIEKHWPGISIKYDISAQTMLPAKIDPSKPMAAVPQLAPQLLGSGEVAKSFGVFTTHMKLTLKVLHEGDVLAILGDLKAAKLGRFEVDQCSFKRTGGSAIDAECDLTWLSMKPYTP